MNRQITVYKDEDPYGKGEYFSYVSENGHVLANFGGFATEEQARKAAESYA